MTSFDSREKSFEDKFANDAELQFKVRARRNKLLGLWAAEKLRMEGDAAKNYAFSIIDEDNKLPGDSDVIEKLAKDLAGKATITQIEAQLIECEKEAKKQLLGN